MPLAFKKITDEKDLRGKRVLLRLDLNLPVVGTEVRDDFRVRRSLPTLQFLKDAGAKTIIVSHLENEFTDSLSRIASHLAKFIPIKAFVTKLDDAHAVVDSMKEGEIIMIENLRSNLGEKANDPVFAGRLASLADIYVNDAFAVCHRSHASIVSVPKLLDSYAGPLLAEEIEELSKAFNPKRPFLFILGGAKFDTKLPLIEKFMNIADYVFIGGALANDVFKEKGFEVGRSTVSDAQINLKHIEMNPKLILPSDVVVATPLSKQTKPPESVGPDETIMDSGPQTISELSDLLHEVQFVLWNGPLGNYEKGFFQGTEDLARAIAESSARSIIGGGDTIAAIDKMGLLDKFSFVSTGGGAMIEFLAQGTLPGIEALKRSL
jgi:phosphoglycerate kinase